jgi:hypothetical protein
MLSRRLVWALLLCALASSSPVLARELRGAAFEESVGVALNGQRMGLAGISAVERNYLSLYAVGLYVTQSKPDPAQLAKGQVACRIALQWLAPSVNAEAARTYWMEEFNRSTGGAAAVEHLSLMINRFISAASPAARGDILLLDYDPEMGLALTRNGTQVARYPGVEFARAVLGIWLSDKAPADRREELLGRAQPTTATLQ